MRKVLELHTQSKLSVCLDARCSSEVYAQWWELRMPTIAVPCLWNTLKHQCNIHGINVHTGPFKKNVSGDRMVLHEATWLQAFQCRKLERLAWISLRWSSGAWPWYCKRRAMENLALVSPLEEILEDNELETQHDVLLLILAIFSDVKAFRESWTMLQHRAILSSRFSALF